MTVKIGIIDYGMGNQGSIVTTSMSMDYKVSLARKPVQVKKRFNHFARVGAFPEAMKNLKKVDLPISCNN